MAMRPSNPPIILGRLETILRLPKAGMKNPAAWTQVDSDTIAHLCQVDSQIRQSRWYKTDFRYTVDSERPDDNKSPSLEDFLYAAVYFRQLIAVRDSLLDDAVTRYCKFVDCQSRPSWVRHEVSSFHQVLDNDTFPSIGFKARELFDAFIYGAGLLHKFPDEKDAKRKRFLEIIDKRSRPKVLFCLNGALLMLKNHVSAVSTVISRDYSHWLRDYELPLPDVRWHQDLFKLSQ